MEDNDLAAISSALDSLMAGTADPREVLVGLIRRYGVDRAAGVARIVIGSWRTRVDEVERVLDELVAEHRRGN